VWAIDPTGKFLLEDKIRTKLLTVPEPLRIALITRGKLDLSYKRIDDNGWTLVRRRLGTAAPEVFESVAELLDELRTTK
jgi:type III restriction enzyme